MPDAWRLGVFTGHPMSYLNDLEQRARGELVACNDEASLRAWKTKYFGNHGEVLQALKKVGELPKEERREYGLAANRLKEALTQECEAREGAAKEASLAHSLQANALDVTMPGRPVRRGRLHVATRV